MLFKHTILSPAPLKIKGQLSQNSPMLEESNRSNKGAQNTGWSVTEPADCQKHSQKHRTGTLRQNQVSYILTCVCSMYVREPRKLRS